MAQFYSDESRENEATALPDAEVFYHEHAKRELCALNAGDKADLYGECILDSEGDCLGTGWYYWYCFPGCMPDSDPIGPFATEREAIDDARDNE